MDFTVADEEYEVVTVVPEKILCETIKSETSADDSLYYTESLESFHEHPEIIGKQWIERIIQDTRHLTQWQKQKVEDFQKFAVQYRGVAFVPCPIPHPHGDLPTTNRDIKINYCGNQNSFPLETTLSKVSKGKRGKYKCSLIDGDKKFRPEVITAGSFIHGVPPAVAIENYCQQHAYSRARLLRTDRRELANELLELISTDSDTSEIHIAHSSRSASPQPKSHASLLTTQFEKQINISPLWQTVDGPQTDASNAGGYNSSDRKDTKYSSDCHPKSSTGNAAATQSSVLCKDFKRKETVESKTVWTGQYVADMDEPLKIVPCVFLSNEAQSESRRKFIRRHKSVPRFIPKSIN